MIALIASLLFLLASVPAPCETLQADLAVTADAAGALPDAADLRAGVQRLFNVEYGSIVTLSFDSAQTAPSSAHFALGLSGGAVTVSTDLTRAGATRSLSSTVPTGSPASLLSAMAGDAAFLFFAARGLSTLPLSPPPVLSAILSTDTLATLTGWNPDELEPIGIAGSGEEVTLCFPHRYLTLGARFGITASTLRDVNAQALAMEPTQLSGVVRGTRGRLHLLSERSASIVTVDPRLGTRSVAEAHGLSGLAARRVGAGTIASLSGKNGGPGILLFAPGQAPLALPVAASYVSAFDMDREGNIWAWDLGERRVRVLTLSGREIFSVRPLFSAATMPLPQQLAVFDDGSFVLAGSGEAWKFQSSGIPVWRLKRIPGRPGEALPPAFDLSVDTARGTLTILDQQSRRLLAFSPAAGPDQLAAVLARLDTRRSADLHDASTLARAGGLGLMALQFGALLSRGGGPDADRASSVVELLAEKAVAGRELADGLAQDLLLERADSAYLRTTDTLRELAAEAPGDQSVPPLLADVVSRRREVRASLTGSTTVRVSSARLSVVPGPDCGGGASLIVSVRNGDAQPAASIRLHLSIPALDLAPSLIEIERMSPSEERTLSVPLGRLDALPAASLTSVQAAALVTWQRGQEGVTSAFSFPVQVAQAARTSSPAEAAACRAVAQDTLGSSLPDLLLAGPRPPVSGGSGAAGATTALLADLAGVLDSLGAAHAETTDTAPAASSPPMRGLLRALTGDEADWTVVTASIASSLGIPAAFVARGDRVLALVDTGVPLADALAALPALQRYAREMMALSAGGTLWVPLSGRVPPAGVRPSLWAFTDGLAALADVEPASVQRAELTASPRQENAPMPFPLVVPRITPRVSLAELRDAAAAALP